MPRFSIVLPVKNGGQHFKDCVASILNQSFRDFNLIVLDNVSTDGSVEWIKSVRDSRVKLFESDRPLSIEENWSRILKTGRNEFMTIIGHDDLLHENYLAEMEQLIQKHPSASLYQTHFRYIDGYGRFIRPCKPMKEIQFAEDFLATQFLDKIDSTGTGYMMRSADFDAVGGMPVNFPNLIFADYALWIKLMMRGFKATSEKECFSYRVHDSVSKLTNGVVYFNAFGEYVEFLDEIKKNNSGIQAVIDENGKQFLLKFCESLAHRLLKTPKELRSIGVKELVNSFYKYAVLLLPEQDFEPLDRPGIKWAVFFDSNSIIRSLFLAANRLRRSMKI
jgi:glycosyltransferase involved in cell wall biosynthesis